MDTCFGLLLQVAATPCLKISASLAQHMCRHSEGFFGKVQLARGVGVEGLN